MQFHLIGGKLRVVALFAATAWLLFLFLLTACLVTITLSDVFSSPEGRGSDYTPLSDPGFLAFGAILWVSGYLLFRGAWRQPSFWRVTRDGDWIFRNGFGRSVLVIRAGELRAFYPGYISWKRWDRFAPEYGEDWGELLEKSRDPAGGSVSQSARELLQSRNITMIIESCEDRKTIELPDSAMAAFLPKIGYTNLILDRLHQLNSRGMHRYRPHGYARPTTIIEPLC
ncbi:MAG: hypothetical protein NXI24_24580 [bacterium]|nr:hypothetical protein [bacterium]